jgi:hypothetical protein
MLSGWPIAGWAQKQHIRPGNWQWPFRPHNRGTGRRAAIVTGGHQVTTVLLLKPTGHAYTLFSRYPADNPEHGLHLPWHGEDGQGLVSPLQQTLAATHPSRATVSTPRRPNRHLLMTQSLFANPVKRCLSCPFHDLTIPVFLVRTRMWTSFTEQNRPSREGVTFYRVKRRD